MSLRIDGTKLQGKHGLYYPKQKINGYLVHEVSGNFKYQYQGEQLRDGKGGITYVYPVDGLTFTGQGDCSLPFYDCLRKSPTDGWKFYRSTSLLTVDSAYADFRWEDSHISGPITGDRTFDNYKYSIVQMANDGETPSLTCPIDNSRESYSFNVDKNYSGSYVDSTGVSKTGLWNVKIWCWGRINFTPAETTVFDVVKK
jgi:hypothetical protein